MMRTVFETSGKEISLWIDGGIMLKVREPYGDPVELSEEAIELAHLLLKLADECKSGTA